jgi:3-phenylpropionate/trans-cinnamate dioxygenase ferredoxin reductase subunit
LSPRTCLIVGAGQAGAQAAISLRQLGYDGALTLLGEEPLLPYQRPPLSKQFLAGKSGAEALLLRDADYYRKRGIEVFTGCRAVGIDRAARQLRLADGRSLTYDRLLLATGGRARRLDGMPGAGLQGVHALRTVADVAGLRDALRPGLRAALVGGGYIGLETAAVLRGLGCEVCVLEAQPRLLSRAAPAVVSEFLHGVHRAHGVRIELGAGITALRGAGRVEAVSLADGRTIPADLVVAGIGLLPNSELAAAAGLDCDGGILVDAACRSSDPSIYAAGDVAVQAEAGGGRRLRIESVENAVWQGKAAASAMLGLPVAARETPWFWSDQYQHKLQIAGIPEPQDRALLRGDPGSGHFGVFHLREGRITAACLVNQPAEFVAARALIAERLPLCESALADSSLPLRRLRQAA